MRWNGSTECRGEEGRVNGMVVEAESSSPSYRRKWEAIEAVFVGFAEKRRERRRTSTRLRDFCLSSAGFQRKIGMGFGCYS
ncbi:hypothetical protein MA16_Dca024563 [Dendrobium catenatum]|uniref:Uncharacterized protein n=1 Tax=Dendrobium catenatum TaxID=906689 RepID=A0A2I0X5H6_9ASPA|nr:hypothetical protein MA16_Dca024563 [Dendrobium catenatum]